MTKEIIDKLIAKCNEDNNFTSEKFEIFGFNVLVNPKEFIRYNLIRDYSEDEEAWVLREDSAEDIAQWFDSCETNEEFKEWHMEFEDILLHDEEVILLLKKYAEKY